MNYGNMQQSGEQREAEIEKLLSLAVSKDESGKGTDFDTTEEFKHKKIV